MSALIAVVPDNSEGWICTDTAVVEPDDAEAHVSGFASKCFCFPHSGLAVAIRGPLQFAAQFTLMAMYVPDFNSAETELPKLFDPGKPGLRELSHWDCVILGYSERENGMRLARMTWQEPKFVRTSAFAGPPLTADQLAEAGVVGTDGSLQIQNPEADLLQLIELQRAIPQPWHSGDAFLIGGQAVLTRITRDKIEQRVVRKWPDKVGERIVA